MAFGGLPGDAGEYRISPTERHHRHLEVILDKRPRGRRTEQSRQFVGWNRTG